MYDENIINGIKEKLSAAKYTVAVAESVTSGHLQAALSSATLAADFYQGGITVYNLGQKVRHLDVEPIHAESCDCVSDNVAGQMALAINRKFLSTYGISITGYAKPVPEKGIHERFAWFSISFMKEILLVKKITSSKTDSVEVQIDFTNQVLSDFLSVIDKR